MANGLRDNKTYLLRNRSIICSAALASTACLLVLYNKPSARIDKLVFQPAQIRVIAERETESYRELSFRLVNCSNFTATIHKIDTSCSCTLVNQLKRSVLAPGEHLDVELRVSFPAFGQKEVRVTAVTSPPEIGEATLLLTVVGPERQLPYVETLPAELRIATTSEEAPTEVDCVIQTVERAGSSPWLCGAVAVGDRLHGDLLLPPKEEVGEQSTVRRTYKLHLIATSAAATDQSERVAMTIRTNEADSPRRDPIVIQAVLVRQPRIRAVPKAIHLKRQDVERWPVVRKVLFASSTINIRKVEVVGKIPSWVVCSSVGDDSHRNSQVLVVEIHEPPATQHDNISEKIRFLFNGEPSSDAAAMLTVTVEE